MTTLQDRGRYRLMLRLPAWRAEIRDAVDPDFLDVCEAYELACCGIIAFGKAADRARADEFREMARWLENEALHLALWNGSRLAI